MSINMRKNIVDILTATRSQSEGVTADTILTAIYRHEKGLSQYLKEGETPLECIERNRWDCRNTLQMLAQERKKTEALRATLAKFAHAMLAAAEEKQTKAEEV